MATSEDIALANEALALIGANAITSFSDTTIEGLFVNYLYETTAEARLGAHRYSFAAKQALLVKNGTDPLTEYDSKYDLPNDFLIVHRVLLNDCVFNDFERMNDGLYMNTSDDDEVHLIYGFRQATSLWPPLFKKAFRYEIAAELFLAIKRDRSRGEMMREYAEQLYSDAALALAQEHRTRRVNTGRFRQAR